MVQNEAYRLDPDGKVHTLARGVHLHDFVLQPDGRLRGEHLWYEPQQEKFSSHGFDLTLGGVLTRLPEPTVFERYDAKGNRYVSETDRLVRITPEGQRVPVGGVRLPERSAASTGVSMALLSRRRGRST